MNLHRSTLITYIELLLELGFLYGVVELAHLREEVLVLGRQHQRVAADQRLQQTVVHEHVLVLGTGELGVVITSKVQNACTRL